MEIIGLRSLTDKQIEQIQVLQQYCMAFDQEGRELFLSNDINYHKKMLSFFLSYHDDVLCGVLIVFAPTIETAEISAYVHPDYRKTGVFSGLLLEAWRTIHSYHIDNVLIVTDAAGTVCKEILTKWQAKLSHSEYLLVYHGEKKQADFPYANQCIVREAKLTDQDKMIKMNMANFGENQENAAHMVRENFNHEQTNCFVGLVDDEIFGLVNVRKEGSDFYICGFNIAPSHQGKGFGRYLLYQILERLTPTKDESITLEVDSINQAAYRLYTTSGFAVKSQADYYRLELPIIPA